MIETHPFKVFAPPKAKYLLLGSFTAVIKDGDTTYDWYYSSKRNQFWPILEKVYGLKLENKMARQRLFSTLSIAVADIFYQCERKKGNSLDSNLHVLAYNTPAIKKLLKKRKIKKIYFSSRFVEKEFKKHLNEIAEEFPSIDYVTLPSPSPRYALMTKEEKVTRYIEILPTLR